MTPDARSGAAEPGDRPPVADPSPVGLSVLHLFCHLGPDWSPDGVRAAEEAARKEGAQVVSVAMLGHKADVGFMVLSPEFAHLRAFQTGVQASGLVVSSSYLSLTEVSEYAAGVPDAMRQARLFPELPPAGKPAFCFYPMSKRRTAGHNWYALGFDERKELMMGHGRLGRTFHGRVLQVVTGSTGLDDWEWGVTLFATAPGDLKDCVYRMRFDEASAHYAEFGPFLAGTVGDLHDVLAQLGPTAPR